MTQLNASLGKKLLNCVLYCFLSEAIFDANQHFMLLWLNKLLFQIPVPCCLL